MEYKRLKLYEIFNLIQTEEEARNWIWRSKYGGKDFICPHCNCERFYSIKTRPEIRKCASCRRQIRIRSGTIFQCSKISLLIWTRSLSLMMQGKRGISATEIKRIVGIKTYETSWGMLHKIREALRQRDENYKLDDVVELDGAQFARRENGEQVTVLIAVQVKNWRDENNKPKTSAGFAKVMMTRESTICAQKFVDKYIEHGTMVNTDGNNSYTKLKNVEHDYQIVEGNAKILDHWLPWVHKFISNAKTWLIGTHHGVSRKNIEKYLAEYTYRFNRRHDPNSLFNRALTACALAHPITLGALSR